MATAERGGSAKPFEKGLSQNFKQINSPLNPNLQIVKHSKTQKAPPDSSGAFYSLNKYQLSGISGPLNPSSGTNGVSAGVELSSVDSSPSFHHELVVMMSFSSKVITERYASVNAFFIAIFISDAYAAANSTMLLP